MGFGVDYSKAFELLPEGDYEVIVMNAHQTFSRAGTPCISVPLLIRNDVDQPGQNRYIYHNLWKRREPSPDDLAVDGYSFKRIQQLSKAAGIANGKPYESLDEWCADLENRLLLVSVKHEEYQGRKSAKTGYIMPSSRFNCTHAFKDKPDAPVFVDADDDDDDLVF